MPKGIAGRRVFELGMFVCGLHGAPPVQIPLDAQTTTS